MPQFRVTKTTTALFRETHLVDAANADEAARMVAGGSGVRAGREFFTSPGVCQPAEHDVAVSEVMQMPTGFGDKDKNAEYDESAEFANAKFVTPRGGNFQRVVEIDS